MKIAVINPVSSGKCLLNSLEDLGAEIITVFEPHLAGDSTDCHIYSDIETSSHYLKKERVEAIINGSEYGTRLTDQLNFSMKFPSNVINKLTARTDKFYMVQALMNEDIRCSKSLLISSVDELKLLRKADLNWPLFIKPVASAGSDGCKRCDNFSELIAAFQEIHDIHNLLGNNNSSVLVQEYIDGEQYIVNSVSLNGEHLISEVYRVRIDHCEGVPVYRSIMTVDIQSERQYVKEIVDYIKTCLNALGIREGAAHSELRMTRHGPCLIEVNSRIMGPVLDADAFYTAFGYNQPALLAESIMQPHQFKLRLKNSLPQPRKHFAMIFIRCVGRGRITHRRGLDNIRRLPGFHSMKNIPELGYQSKNPLLTTGDFGIAYFSHEDRVLLKQSVAVLHKMEDEQIVFGVLANE